MWVALSEMRELSEEVKEEARFALVPRQLHMSSVYSNSITLLTILDSELIIKTLIRVYILL
jgi:hypothetical protein